METIRGIRKERSDGLARLAERHYFELSLRAAMPKEMSQAVEYKKARQTSLFCVSRQESFLDAGGSGGIRTLEPIARLLDFESSPL